MFDFTPVGLSVAVVGLLYITLVGWRLIPGRGADTEAGDRFHIEAYVSEVRLVPESPLVGTQIRKIEQLCENEATVMAILRGKRRLLAPGGGERLEQDDILLLEGDPAALQPLIESGGLLQVGEEEVDPKLLRSDDIRLVEAVVMPNARLEGWSMRGLKMHEHFGVNLLAVSRQGQSPKTRLGSIRFKVGDVILLQGDRTTLKQVLPTLGCLPLAERGLNVVRRRRILLPVGIFAVAIAATALGWVPVQIAFVTAVVALVVSGGLPLREAYRSIEWPIVILLGALIPVGEALHATGGTEVIAGGIITLASGMPLWGMLALLMVSSMLLSDLIHNSPTAVLMAPVAIGIAEGLADRPSVEYPGHGAGRLPVR
jgi:di/tricarboxylate transporter